VGERAQHEIYFPPFKAAVQEGKTWCVMTSYNRINGTYACENMYTITHILREEWGFTGLVVSDWMGTQSTAASVNAGQDLEMPGPAVWRGEKLLQAVRNGEVSEATIEKCARRILELLEKAGKFEHPESQPEQANDRPEHRALLRKVAGEGMVLLKNKGTLPLSKETLQSIALIGPNAKVARFNGGGSASVNPYYLVTPFEGMIQKLGPNVNIGYEQGCSIHKMLPLINPAWLGTEGLGVDFYNNLALSGNPVASIRSNTSIFFWLGYVAEGLNPIRFSGRLTGTLKPEEGGIFTFGISGVCPERLLLNGKEIIDNWTNFRPSLELMGGEAYEGTAEVSLEAGKTYQLEVVFRSQVDGPWPFAGIRIGLLPPVPANSIQRAAQLAARSDVAVIFAGFGPEWESEGFDRPDMQLAGDQDTLIEMVVAANPNTIVVLNTGAPITMPWLDKVAAVVQAWYPGQECGNAIADVLFGDVIPGGKLPQTFPIRLEDNPAYINYPGENGRVYYGEGLFVGYRYYDKKKIAPLFPFGYGLSYTTFDYGPLSVSKQAVSANQSLTISIDVTNTGKCAGKEVVQLYIRDVASRLHRPEKELKGFTKVDLQPGERKTVHFEIGREALAYYDDSLHQWVAEAGEFEVLVGTSSQDIRSRGKFTLQDTVQFPG
jgi:beta-glucosidase